MADEIKLEDLSNNEIKLKMINLKNEYEAIQSKMKLLLVDLQALDKQYLQCKKVINERLGTTNVE